MGNIVQAAIPAYYGKSKSTQESTQKITLEISPNIVRKALDTVTGGMYSAFEGPASDFCKKTGEIAHTIQEQAEKTKKEERRKEFLRSLFGDPDVPKQW